MALATSPTRDAKSSPFCSATFLTSESTRTSVPRISSGAGMSPGPPADTGGPAIGGRLPPIGGGGIPGGGMFGIIVSPSYHNYHAAIHPRRCRGRTPKGETHVPAPTLVSPLYNFPAICQEFFGNFCLDSIRILAAARRGMNCIFSWQDAQSGNHVSGCSPQWGFRERGGSSCRATARRGGWIMQRPLKCCIYASLTIRNLGVCVFMGESYHINPRTSVLRNDRY